jgi:hypothetical protein
MGFYGAGWKNNYGAREQQNAGTALGIGAHGIHSVRPNLLRGSGVTIYIAGLRRRRRVAQRAIDLLRHVPVLQPAEVFPVPHQDHADGADQGERHPEPSS